MKTSQPLRFLRYLPLCVLAVSSGWGQSLYQFGNPSADEQLYIELINRARADPPAEGARLAGVTDADILAIYDYYDVDLVMMRNEFNAIGAAPPLAPNAALTTAARGHSQWMLANATQSHEETNPSNDTEGRIEDAGYDWWNYGENVFAYSNHTWFGHAGFQVDWGPGPGGMQNPRGHRESIHYQDFREIGVGVVNGSNGGVGPQVVTQDFGDPFDGRNFGTGVAYYDLNSNDFYDVGEGIAGLSATVSGADFYCTTAIGGGWVVPIPSPAATRTVSFSGLGINQTRNLSNAENANGKLDLKLVYTPPVISGAATATAGNTHPVTFSPIGGATGYHLNRWNIAAAPVDNCEMLADATVSTTGSYQVLVTTVKHQGTASFHLANPGAPGNQIIELNSVFHGANSPALAFQSRLGISTSSEHHRVQVKEEGTGVWRDVYNQDGGTPEASFTQKAVQLPTMAGKEFRVRFVLNFKSGSTYANTGDSYGWFIDAISFSNISTLTNPNSQLLAGTSASISPPAGNYLISVSPVVSGIAFPGSDKLLTVVSAGPSFASWAAAAENGAALPAGTIANSPNADPDHDGRVNLVEYAFGTSPVAGDEPSPRHPGRFASTTHFVIRYIRDNALADIEVAPVACSALSGWKEVGQQGAPVGFTDMSVSTSGNLETREAKIPLSSAGSQFIRLKITRL